MGMTARASLPGFDAGTDTNLDHYSLYADVDNVMIKTQSSGLGTIGTAGTLGYTTGTITHNLGYTPFFLEYHVVGGSNTWAPINNQYSPISVPGAIGAADTKNIYVVNFNGANTLEFAYEIFYDNMSSGTPTITESSEVIKITRPGKDASSKNPNDYIMHSDLNTYKILSSGTTVINSSISNQGTILHGGTIQRPVQTLVYMKSTDNKVVLLGDANTQSYDGSFGFNYFSNLTNIFVDINGANGHTSGTFNGTAAYFVTGAGTTNTVSKGYELAVSKKGVDVGTATNPDDFNFHSSFPTLKYYSSGTFTMTNVAATTYGTIAHNLGYTPVFIGFVNDFTGIAGSAMNGNTESVYAICPFYYGNSSLATPRRDIGAFIYADSTNIYFKAWYDINAVGTYSFTFYYKIFKNNLGL